MFSVVIPAFNARATLRRAVESVLGQRGPALELIVVDDGSTDGGAVTIADIADPRLRILHQPNLGGGAARNTGIEAARNDWVALLDADDLWLDGHLAELDRVRREFPDAGLIGTAFATAQPGEAAVRVPVREGRIDLVNFIAAAGRGERPFNASSVAIRKAAWEDVGRGSTRRDGVDSELFARLSLSWPVAASDRVTSIYLRATGSHSDRIRQGRQGRAYESLGDLSASVEMLLGRYDTLTPAIRRDVDAYVRRYFGYRVSEAVADRDLVALQSLRRLREHQPPVSHRLFLAASALPRPLALGVIRCIALAGSAARRVRPATAEPFELVTIEPAPHGSGKP